MVHCATLRGKNDPSLQETCPFMSETDSRCNLSFGMMDLEAKGDKKNLRGFLGQGFQRFI